jgi:hypothetical protein
MFNVPIERAAWEACSATWNLGTNTAFTLGSGKTKKSLIELAGRMTFRMQTGFDLVFSLYTTWCAGIRLTFDLVFSLYTAWCAGTLLAFDLMFNSYTTWCAGTLLTVDLVSNLYTIWRAYICSSFGYSLFAESLG